jgi:hypothetical protein
MIIDAVSFQQKKYAMQVHCAVPIAAERLDHHGLVMTLMSATQERSSQPAHQAEA